LGRQPSVATVAKAVTLQITPEQAQKVVLVGNIGKFSLCCDSPVKVAPLQNDTHDG
jgi:Flp pilus assembly protein CpaB